LLQPTRDSGDVQEGAHMETLTVDELDRLAARDTLTQDEIEDLWRRAQSEPEVWTIVPPATAAYVHDPAPATIYAFTHRPTGKNYGFGYAPHNGVWFWTPDRAKS
jgi:hypothetical protein